MRGGSDNNGSDKADTRRILVCFVVAGVVLGAVGIYAPLAKWAGAGATVPLTGFRLPW